MKNLLKKLVAFILNKKTIDLDNDGKIETLREEVSGVFSQFKRMSDKLIDVNNKLDEIVKDEEFVQEVERDQLERIIAEANARLEESSKRVEKAQLEKQANLKLNEKVQEFIV
jgi:hypothetical protein